MTLSLVHSTCPNDTFVFHAWTHGLIAGTPPVTVRYADVDEANALTVSTDLDVVKVSYAALPWLLDRYELLPCGGALGRGCGPLIVTNGRTDLNGARVAVPGERTTAYLLFRLFAEKVPLAKVDVLPFPEIMPAVRDGRYDAGLVIHEARFTYKSHGLSCLADLGEWWERETGAAIPLGAILGRRGLDRGPIVHAIQASLDYAWKNPNASRGYVLEQAQELDPAVAEAHIALYVTAATRQMTRADYEAVRLLLDRAAVAGFSPAVGKGLIEH
jgi:1,4-dihydroxy-6-naphthoate synthase